jgi:hypothetical protein
MTDIVKRLRSFDVFNAPMDIEGVMVSPVALMAADEIERLRNALREIAEDGPEIPLDEDGEGPNWPMHIYAMKWASFSTELQNIARNALKELDRD